MKGKTYRKDGGKVEEGVVVKESTPTDVYAGGDSNVVKEAKDRSGKFKKGGKVGYIGRGRESGGMHEFEKMKKEKKAKKDGGSCEGMSSAHRLDRAKRASGGPLSTASKISNRPGGRMEAIDN